MTASPSATASPSVRRARAWPSDEREPRQPRPARATAACSDAQPQRRPARRDGQPERDGQPRDGGDPSRRDDRPGRGGYAGRRGKRKRDRDTGRREYSRDPRCVCHRAGHGVPGAERCGERGRRAGGEPAGGWGGPSPGAEDYDTSPSRQRRPVRVADPAGGHHRLHPDRQGTADPRRAALPRCGHPQRHSLGAARGLRLDAVQGAAALLARARREAGHARTPMGRSTGPARRR